MSLTLSLLLVSLTLLKSRRVFRSVRQGQLLRFAGLVLADGLLGLAIFYLFLWLSPQLYYLYYLTLFESLTWQVVVAAPPSLGQLFALLQIPADASLAEISLGVLGRGLLLVTLLTAAQRLWRPYVTRR